MKTALKLSFIAIVLFLLIQLLISCEKEPISYNGTYRGTIEYYLPGYPQVTEASRIISDNGYGTSRILWWESEDVYCYTVIESGKYQIWNVELLTEPYCLGVKQKNKLLFNGSGRFIGDSLIETGIIYHYTNMNTEAEKCESGTWVAKFKKQ